MNYDNPAYRLLTLIERGKALKPERGCRECWEELLEVSGDVALLVSRLGRVMALPQMTVRAISEGYPAQGNTWTHWESQISVAFMVQNLHAEWTTFISHIDSHSVTYLKLASELLNSKSASRLLDSAEVTDVRDRVSILLKELLDSDINAALKAQVFRCLRKVLDALDEYKVTGGVAVLESAEGALGHAAVDSEYHSFLTDTELGERILDCISAAANLLTIAIGIPQLTVALTPLLR